jgi:hypothetical protein
VNTGFKLDSFFAFLKSFASWHYLSRGVPPQYLPNEIYVVIRKAIPAEAGIPIKNLYIHEMSQVILLIYM